MTDKLQDYIDAVEAMKVAHHKAIELFNEGQIARVKHLIANGITTYSRNVGGDEKEIIAWSDNHDKCRKLEAIVREKLDALFPEENPRKATS